MFKQILKVLASLVFVLPWLTGCGSDGPSAYDTYRSDVRAKYSQLDATPDWKLDRAADRVCGYMLDGGTLNGLFLLIAGSDVEPEVGGYIAGKAMADVCPETLTPSVVAQLKGAQ